VTSHPATSGAPVVRVAGVGKTFGTDSGGVRALDDINLSIGEGEFVSLIGPSGCGKSTLLRLIGDLTSPSEGVVEVNGKPARRARQDRDYGMVFQAPVLMEWRTVARNIELPLEIMGYKKEDRLRRSSELLKLVELEGFEGRHPWQLSGGMQQRVAIARALSCDPELLLMDEPFGSVDAQTREDLEDLTLRVRRERGITILLVTHDIDESVYVGDRVVVLSPGPGRVRADLAVNLPEPRDQITTKELPEFVHLRTEVSRLVRSRLTSDEAPVPGSLAHQASRRD
jgi:NitT/TauT family transport system ATP-binding protein